jgi:hypothetical protein
MASVVKWVVAGVLAAGLAAASNWRIESLPEPSVEYNILFVPPEKLVTEAASGFDNLIADGLWLGLLQYYGDRVVSDDHKFMNLPAAFRLITRLDSHFWFAYWLGAFALGDSHEPDAAITMLRWGEQNNPDDYNYPYLAGFVNFAFAKDHQAAANCFERSATKPNASRFARTMAARMYQTEGQDALALGMWQSVLKGAEAEGDKSLIAIAKRNVSRIQQEMAGLRKPAFRKKPRGISARADVD